MRLADLSVRIQAKFQQPPRTLAEITESISEILRNDLVKIAEYNVSAAHAHLDDLERRMEIAKQSESVLEMARWQFQRLPESGMRLTADVMRNIDILQNSRGRIMELIEIELKKQWFVERQLPQRFDRLITPFGISPKQ